VLQKLEQAGVNLKNQKKQTITTGNFKGLSFLLPEPYQK
jgi:hypothetical protein